MAKCKSYDLNFKFKVIFQAEYKGNMNVARQLYIDEKQIGSGGSRKVAYRKK